MPRATLKLRRWWPPGSKTVAVGAITVGGYMGLVQYVATHVAKVRLSAKRDITGADWIRALRGPDWCFFADLVCEGQRPGFFSRWLNLKNVNALLQASAVANNWDRILATLNLSGEVRRRGSVMDDVVAVCRMVGGQSVNDVLAMPMESFLDVVDTLNRDMAEADPTTDPDAVPSEAADLLTVPGLAVVH